MDIVESIKHDLLSRYHVDSFIFIEDLEKLPSSTLYRSLLPWIKDPYDPDYRFVFFNFFPVNNETLIHVANTIKFFDISPFFVLVITNQKETEDFFKSLAEPVVVNYVDNRINREIPKVTTPLFNNNNHMCAHAWSGLHITSSGYATLCCQYGDTIKDNNGNGFNIKTHEITEIFKSDYLKEIRTQFRNGITPKGCHKCVLQEKQSGESKRSIAPYKLKNVYGFINWEDESDFTWIGGHLGNLCNLKCRICSENFSSSIAAEKLQQIPSNQIKSSQVYTTLINNNWNKEDFKFWKSLKSMVPKIKNFEFLGGEPLMVESNLKFLQYLVDNNYSQECIFEFVTNGTQYPSVFDYADRFKELFVTVSIDDIGKRFELERSGANWSDVDSNLAKFVEIQKKTSSFKVGVSITVSIQNVFYLPELIQYLNDKQVNHYYISLLFAPPWLSVDQMTPEAKKLVLNRLSTANLASKDLSKIQYVITAIQNSKTSDGSEFCKNMKSLDRLRKENFAETHPEIAKAMGYNFDSKQA